MPDQVKRSSVSSQVSGGGGPSSTAQQTSTASSADNFFTKAPTPTLPKGGGAIQGIGEKFAANPVTGTGSMSVPIATSPGRSGFGPQLSLSYDSGSGNGPFGFGWTLALPQIGRKTAKGLPRYLDAEESDVFLISGAEDLVPELKDGAKYEDDSSDSEYIIHRYRPRIEGLFARIERWTRKADGDVHWRSISKDNVLSIFGNNAASRIVAPDNKLHIFSWLICETRDDKGNVVVYDYKKEDGVGVDLTQPCESNRGGIEDNRRTTNRYLKQIRYGNEQSLLENGKRPRFLTNEKIDQAHWMFKVVFDYGEHNNNSPKPDDSNNWIFRNDPFSTYRSGFEVRTTRLCQRVLMFHHFPGEQGVGDNCLVSSTDFTYSHQQEPDNSRNPIYTFLHKATHSGYKLKADANYIKRSMPPLEFEYSEPVVQETVKKVDSTSLENLPIGVDGVAYQWTDLHGEGIPGILTEQADAWFYKRNVSPIGKHPVEFAPLERVATKPNLALSTGAQFMDLAGDGQPDLVALDGRTPGLYEHDGKEGWQPFRPFTSRLNRDTRDPNLKFVDLDGDGHADVLITEDDAFVWHASLAEEGFGPARRVTQALDEEKGPRLVFADGTQSVYLADLGGDGLTDLVRIRNGEVCYWPNLGYGRFGAKITMDHSPRFDHPDQFSQQRIRLADIDGSGTIDIIYLHRDGVRLYFNHSGNGFSDARKLKVFPRVDELVSIKVADLLGNGTACLVWCSPLPGDAQQPMRYVNLMGKQKPHLLIKSMNNLGAETEIQYAPSTKFYLQDKYNGKPWITKLPFPVHVVEKVTVTDKWRKTKFATSYSYHHGYFNAFEREFRGFGRVEQVDIEDYGTFTQGNAASPYITDDNTLYQPPVKTITWFHTGAFLQRDKILNQFEHEYFPNNLSRHQRPVLGDFQEKQLLQPDLNDADLNSHEWREALRACKGMTLRQEVYELDIEALEQRGLHQPNKLFSAAYHSYHIKLLQHCVDNRHAVFLVTKSEAISYSYELDMQAEDSQVDPRISHVLNLKTDEYGNVLQALTAVYPRRQSYQDASLPDGADRLITQVQQETHLAYSENRFTNDVTDEIDDYRLKLPCETLSYELTGITTPTDSHYFDLEQMRKYRLSNIHQTQGTEVTEIAYQKIANSIDPQKRLLQHSHILYFSDDLNTPLELGKLNSLALPYESYTLAMTDELLTSILKDKFADKIKEDLTTSSLSGYLYVADKEQYWIRSGIAGFDTETAQHFFLPEQYTDPFGNTTILQYDSRYLYVTRSTDPVENQVQIKSFDYRVLQPSEMEDINGNLSEVVFDVSGFPAAVAVKGSGGAGDSLENFTDELINPGIDTRIQFFTGHYREEVARNLLGAGTARHIYDFGERIDEDGSMSYGHRPASSAAILREQHVTSLLSSNAATGLDQQSPLQVAFEYSDGGGNVLVSKVQAEPESPGGPLRWIANGKTILNNKGKPVKQYEPYFTESHTFADPIEVGVTPIMYYDAAGRLIRTELPDGTINRVEFSQWHVSSYDANDTVFDPDNIWYQQRIDPMASAEDQRSASLAAVHANTPATVFLDSLGREVISVESNKFIDKQGIPQEEKYLTFSKLDAEGKPLWVRDARGNMVMQYITPLKPARAADESDPDKPENIPAGTVPCYDIAGNLLFQHSMDAGDHWIMNDAAGQPFYAWDKNERITENGENTFERRLMHTRYDSLRRPVQQQLGINSSSNHGNEDWNINNWQTIERFVYGDNHTAIYGDTDTAIADTQSRNLRGQLYQRYDAGGRITNESFDFKGNLLKVSRKFSSDYKAAVIHWPEGSPETGLEEENFIQNTEYDALNRMVRMENWHSDGRTPAVYTPKYNERAVLVSETLSVQGEVQEAIQHIKYDAKGQRQRIEYGNGTITRYDYDPQTFRLQQLRTTRNGFDPDFPAFHSAGQNDNVLQQLIYTYDPVGNITEISDEAFEPVFFKNQRVEPRSRYQYDSLYRLIKAQGREGYTAGAPTQINPKTSDVAFPIYNSNDSKVLRNYIQRYRYDAVGNILQMQHVAQQGDWTRHYDYANDSNRLLRTRLGDDELNAVHYDYDTHGSMLNLNRTPEEFNLRWDYRDMIHQVNLGGGGQAWYNYDAEKQRSLKRIERNGNEIEERLYLGGMEVYRRWKNGDLQEEIETHHLFVGEQRCLMVEGVLKTESDLGVKTLYKYQYSNHLGSVGLELDAGAEIISYEEYHPFGTTAYRANNKNVRSTRKHYRYTGMERDEESGLSYHTARYYLPWLGRWGSCDPEGLVDGSNLYRYVRDNPAGLKDTQGTQSNDEQLETDGDWENSLNYESIDSFLEANPALGRLGAKIIWNRDRYTRSSIIAAPPGPNPHVISGEKAVYEFLFRKNRRARRTLSNICSGPCGAIGYMAGGDKGSDVGAAVDGIMMAAGSTVGSRNALNNALSKKVVSDFNSLNNHALDTSQPTILVIGAETSTEFDYALRTSKRGAITTVVNPNETREARSYQRAGGNFVRDIVENLPANARFNLIREDYPFPFDRALHPTRQFVEARLGRLKPSGTWVVITEKPEFVPTLDIAGRSANARVTVYEIPRWHEATPQSSYPREKDRFVVIFSR